MEDEYTLRLASFTDASTLIKHRRWMFEEIIALRGEEPDRTGLVAMEETYREYLRQHLADGSLWAWVVEHQGEGIASGVVTLLACPPSARNLTGVNAYVHSIYTVPQYRRHGLARRIVAAQIDHCREQGLKIVSLHASEAGRSVYEALGFEPRTNEMILRLDPPA